VVPRVGTGPPAPEGSEASGAAAPIPGTAGPATGVLDRERPPPLPDAALRPDRPDRPTAPPPAPARGTRALLRTALRRALTALALLALAALAVVLRRPGYLLEHGFWLDESWVVDSVRAPLGQLGLMTSSTPLGWTLLLRLVPPTGDPERYRLLPLAFAVAGVVPAWWLGWRLARAGWRRPFGAATVALAVAAAPATLARLDLKQYTADVLAVLTVALLASRVEEGWRAPPARRPARRRRPGPVVAFALGCVLFVPVSHAALVALAAALAALALDRALARDLARLRALAATAAAPLAMAAGWYALVTARGNNAQLKDWWAADFVPRGQGFTAAASFVGERLADGFARAGFGPWPVAACLAALGAAGFWLAGRRTLGLYLPVLLTGLVAAGALRLYPLMDERTSTFVSVLLTAYAAAGVATAGAGAVALARAGRGGAPRDGRLRRLAVGALRGAVVAEVVVAAACMLAPAAARGGERPMPESGVRRQVEFVLAHRRPGDAVMVNWSAQFGFAYYWPDRPRFADTDADMAVRFRVAYPGRPDLLVVHRDDWPLTRRTLAAAAAGGARRIWIVIAHGGPGDDANWRAATAGLGAIASPSPRSRPYLLTVGPTVGSRSTRPDEHADRRDQAVSAVSAPLTPSS